MTKNTQIGLIVLGVAVVGYFIWQQNQKPSVQATGTKKKKKKNADGIPMGCKKNEDGTPKILDADNGKKYCEMKSGNLYLL